MLVLFSLLIALIDFFIFPYRVSGDFALGLT
jgi:hypothetical protein